MIHKPTMITIDGPAGTGKSTLGALLAQRLGYLYFDTGVMYRAVTLAAVQRKLDCANQAEMEQLAKHVVIDVVPPTVADGRQYTVLLDQEDVTRQIRSPNVEQQVSIVSKHPGVREELIRQQRAIGERGDVVMVGRDIGTIVVPDAPCKLYLQTSLAERARRRFADEQAKGREVSLEQVQAEMTRRDDLDSHVIYAAEDALILHTDTLTPDESVEWVIARFALEAGNT
jgi:cytidylate kinase